MLTLSSVTAPATATPPLPWMPVACDIESTGSTRRSEEKGTLVQADRAKEREIEVWNESMRKGVRRRECDEGSEGDDRLDS